MHDFPSVIARRFSWVNAVTRQIRNLELANERHNDG